METITPSLAPAPPFPANGQITISKSDDNNAFAPALSQAIAKNNKSDSTVSRKSNPKSVTVHAKNTVVKKDSQRTNKPADVKKSLSNQDDKKVSSSSGKDSDTSRIETSSSPSSDAASDTTPINSSTSQNTLSDTSASKNVSSEDDTNSGTASPGKVDGTTLLFTLNASIYLLATPEATSASDLQKTIEELADVLAQGKQAGPNIEALTGGTSAQQATDASQAGKQDPLATLQNAILQQTKPDTGSTENTFTPPVSTQDQSEILAKSAGSTAGTGQDSLTAQQLQKILEANGMTNSSIVYHQPANQNKLSGLESLSAPLTIIANSQDQQTTPLSEASDNTLTASLTKVNFDKLLASEKSSNKPSSAAEGNLQFLASKTDSQNQIDAVKAQEKDALTQEDAKNQQTGILNPSSITDSTGNAQQAGQYSFNTMLSQNLQTGQHTAGANGLGYQLPWTPLQENHLLNQVTPRFQLNANSQSSQMVLKLYPEELGELKIDLQLKDGVIRANIVAQTEQVQQVLEKYIPKLKSIMEQQGLTVDNILVSNKSDDEGKHDLFQKDFADSQNFSSPGKSAKPTSLADFSFEKAFPEKNDAALGVNVTI